MNKMSNTIIAETVNFLLSRSLTVTNTALHSTVLLGRTSSSTYHRFTFQIILQEMQAIWVICVFKKRSLLHEKVFNTQVVIAEQHLVTASLLEPIW